MELASYLTDNRVISFLLLFVRFSSLLAFIPFFNAQTIPINIKAALAFYLTFLFYPNLPPQNVPTQEIGIFVAILSEATMGLFVGFVLQFVFSYFQAAGEHISTTMGLSMASQIDPQTMQSSPLINQFLSTFTLLIFLAIDGHHTVIMLVNKILLSIPLGGFTISPDWYNYFLQMSKNLFMMGFVIAFPIIALSLLADIIFGMIMKTMPSFNLFVIGSPVKIGVSVAVLTAIFSSFVVIFERELALAFHALEKLLF